MTTRPIYGLTVLRYEDGRTEVVPAYVSAYPPTAAPMPTDWQLRHAMLIEAAAEVKREAGVEPSSIPGQLAEREGEG